MSALHVRVKIECGKFNSALKAVNEMLPRILLSKKVLKIHFIKSGSVTGSYWRKGWRARQRGKVGDWDVVKIFYCDGRTELVPFQRRKTSFLEQDAKYDPNPELSRILEKAKRHL